MTREAQEAFLRDFASDYLYCALQSGNEFIDTAKTQPNTMYGAKTRVLLRSSDSIPLLAPADAASYQAENMTAVLKTDAWFYKNDELLVDTVTTGDYNQQSRRLLKLDWEKTDAKLKLTPVTSDWTECGSLTLDLVPDAADEKKLRHLLPEVHGTSH